MIPIETIYAEILDKEKLDHIYRVRVKAEINPAPGQFISIIFSGRTEIPLNIGSYRDGIIDLYIESEKLYNMIPDTGGYILVKGPLGKGIDIERGKRLIGIAYRSWIYDLKYILENAEKRGIDVRVKCIECTSKYKEPDTLENSQIIASVPREYIGKLPRNSLILARWVKMNCMLGVCGVCRIGNTIPCIQGPFIRVDQVVE